MADAALSNVATQDAYADALTLLRPKVVTITMQVSNAAVYYQFAVPDSWPAPTWGAEVFLKPGLYSFDRRSNGVRFRSAVAGAPARVTVELVQDFNRG